MIPMAILGPMPVTFRSRSNTSLADSSKNPNSDIASSRTTVLIRRTTLSPGTPRSREVWASTNTSNPTPPTSTTATPFWHDTTLPFNLPIMLSPGRGGGHRIESRYSALSPSSIA